MKPETNDLLKFRISERNGISFYWHKNRTLRIELKDVMRLFKNIKKELQRRKKPDGVIFRRDYRFTAKKR